MLVYTDIFSNDELLSDSFPIKEIDGVIYEVECRNVTCGPVKVNIGANPSAEGEEDGEEVDETLEQKIDIVDALKLEETSFDKKSFMTYLKSYIKNLRSKIEESNPSKVTTFETAAQNFAKKILGEFDDFRFFQGESMDPEAMVLLLKQKEDDFRLFAKFMPKKVQSKRIKLKRRAANKNIKDESQDEYEVEKILDMKTIKGKKYYLIKWKDYSNSENTWEEQSNLFCENVLKEFEKEYMQKAFEKSTITNIIQSGKGLLVELTWPDETVKLEKIKIVREAIPQKLLDFYEERLRFDL